MLNKQAGARFRKLKNSPSPYNAGSNQSVQGSKTSPYALTYALSEQIGRVEDALKEGREAAIPEQLRLKELLKEIEAADENPDDNPINRLLKLSGEPYEFCGCERPPANKFCGWGPSPSNGAYVNKPHHSRLTVEKKPVETKVEPEAKKTGKSTFRLTSAQLGYIPNTSRVRRYRFQHDVDAIKEYREKKYPPNQINLALSICPKPLLYGYERARKKPAHERDVPPPRAPTLSAVGLTALTLANRPFENPYEPAAAATVNRAEMCPRPPPRKLIPRNPKTTLDPRAKKANYQPYKPSEPMLPKLPIHSATNARPNLVMGPSFSTLPPTNPVGGYFNLAMQSYMSHLNGTRPTINYLSGGRHSMDNVLFTSQNPFRRNFRLRNKKSTFRGNSLL